VTIGIGGLTAAGLPGGTYRFTIFSNARSSIHGTNGLSLDGDGNGAPGGNYVRTFTVSAFSKYLVTAGTTAVAGVGLLVSIQATDALGNPVTTYTGPPTVTATLSPSTGASNFPVTVSVSGSGLGLFLATIQQAGSDTISVTSGSFSGSSGPVTVTPGPAVALAFVAQPVSTPTGDVLPPVSVQVLDRYGNVVTSDNSDVVSLTVASGPGSFTGASTTTVTVAGGVATFANLRLVKPGTYTLAAKVPFQYTGSFSASFSIVPLEVIPGSLAATPSGFGLQFNAPYLVNSVNPVLYGQGFGVSAPTPSVTLTQVIDASGRSVHNPVEGSLILNPASDSLTFLATNTAYETNTGSPVLPDGTYVIDLTSSAAHDGFQALNAGGGFLDGRGTGIPGSGDYTATFTVKATGQDVVWLPSTADGPGQALSAPGMNQAGRGYPVYLSDHTGAVTNIQVTLDYNPALLTVTGASGGGKSTGHEALLSTAASPAAVDQATLDQYFSQKDVFGLTAEDE
jgi:hypothetical protein